MAKACKWVSAGLGHHIKLGSKILAHVWTANGQMWASIIKPGKEYPMVVGPFNDDSEVQKFLYPALGLNEKGEVTA